MANSYLPRSGNALVLMSFLIQTACTQLPAGSTTPQGTVASTNPSTEREAAWPYGADPAALQHTIIPAEGPDRGDLATLLASASAFSYEFKTPVIRPLGINELVILPYLPAGQPNDNEPERYSVNISSGLITFIQMTGVRPLTQVTLAYSTDGARYQDPTPNRTTNWLILDCDWNEVDPLYLRVRLDGFSLKQTEALQFRFAGNTVASLAVPSLVLGAPIDIAELSSGRQRLETHIRALLEALANDLSSYPALVTVEYESHAPVNEAPPPVRVPVLVAPNLEIGPASRSETVHVLTQGIGQWLDTATPSTTGVFHFKLDFFSRLSTHAAPVLRLKDASLRAESISDL